MLSILLLQGDCRSCNTCCHEHGRGKPVIRRRDLCPRYRQMEIHRLHGFRSNGSDSVRLHRPWDRSQSRLLHPRDGGSHRKIRHPPAHGIQRGRAANRAAQLRNRHHTRTQIRDIARLPIEQIIRSYHPPLWSYEITENGTDIFGPLPSWKMKCYAK